MAAGAGLFDQVVGDGGGEDVHEPVEGGGFCAHEAAGAEEVARAVALDGVAGEGEGGAGEADERDAALEAAEGLAHGLDGVAEGLAGGAGAQAVEIGGGLDRVVEHGAFAADEFQPEAHLVEDG